MWLSEKREKMADFNIAEVFFPQTQGNEKQGWTNLQAGSPTPCYPTTMFSALLPLKKGAKCHWFCITFIFSSTQSRALYYGME